jgi:tetratricopeptide (TPR) repeat protein
MAGAQVAAAQEAQPRVYIVSAPMDPSLDALATRAGSAARAALRQIEGVDWRTPDQRFLGYDDSALSVLERAREQLDAGRAAYLQLELDQAIQQLQGAVENFDAAAAALEDPNDLGQALLFLGASHAFNEQRREAQVVFARLHTQMPHIVPDPDTFPPEVVQMYERSRPRDARNPGGTISIDSNPQGAIAYVDFLARGRTPINVDSLIGGDHVVRVTRPGATPFVETLEARRGRASTSNAYLVDSPDMEGLAESLDQIASAGIERLDASNPIAEVASTLQLDKIGVIRISSAGGDQVSLELLLFDAASGRRLVRGQGSAPTGVGQLEAAVTSAVTAAFRAALNPAQSGDEERIPAIGDGESPIVGDGTQTPAGPPTPIIEEWWFWTIIGVVVVGGIAAGIGAGVASQGPPLAQDPGGQVIFTF